MNSSPRIVSIPSAFFPDLKVGLKIHSGKKTFTVFNMNLYRNRILSLCDFEVEKFTKKIHQKIHHDKLNSETLNCIVFTVHCTLNCVYCTVYISVCTLYSVHCNVFTVHCTVYIALCSLYIVQWTLCCVYCTVYISLCLLYSVYCIVFTVQCTFYWVYCTLYTLSCLLYSWQCTNYLSSWLSCVHILCRRRLVPGSELKLFAQLCAHSSSSSQLKGIV